MSPDDAGGRGLTRREVFCATAAVASGPASGAPAMNEVLVEDGLEPEIAAKVRRTLFVDTHEHLVEERTRTEWKPGGMIPCDDWSVLFMHYIDSDLQVAGMPPGDRAVMLSTDADTRRKWSVLEPWWPMVRTTGYGQAVRLAAEALYGVRDLNGTTIKTVAERYRSTVKPGFYKRLLTTIAGIESCQVNSLERTFMTSEQPTFLMQDISLLNLHTPEQWRRNAEPTGIRVTGLSDYHRVLDWWFDTYGPYAVAAKSQAAYGRRLDFADVPAEQADAPFARLIAGEQLSGDDRKLIEDHLFWYGVRKATQMGLPVKLHTGYYAGHNGMPMARLATNPGDVTELLRRAPDTTFVLMHIGYPFWEQMVAIAKHWHNAVIDMCWAWIIDPESAVRFLRSMLVTAPCSKVLTFGGDFIPVEPVVGHAMVARRGIALALTGLYRDGWISKSQALDLVEPIMRGNAHRIFRLTEKAKKLAEAPWAKPA
jgi:predicted TIM-barrel fold metal-dependent hydrolase